jgi:hypothetical protein
MPRYGRWHDFGVFAHAVISDLASFRICDPAVLDGLTGAG